MTDILSGDHTTISTTTPTADALQTLVGEGKKFKDTESLAKAKLESDAFIAKIQEENQRLREEVTKRTALEEQLARLTQDDAQNSGTSQSATVTSQSSSVSNPADVDALLDKKLDERSTRARQQANIDAVNQALLDRYGDANKAKEAVAMLNASLGINVRELAATSPAAVLKLFGAEQSRSGVPAERSTVNIHGQSSEARDHTYYENLRKSMGNAKFYSDKRLQLELHKSAQSLGDHFYK